MIEGDIRLPLFCDIGLAERIERVEAQLIALASESAGRRRADTTGFVLRIAGGVASFAETGSPFNKIAGLGFLAVVTTQPGSRSQQNVQRRGFDLLYTRAILLKRP